MNLVDVDPKEVLPSDSARRGDAILMKQEQWEEAEAAKHAMEELQRDDKKLRTEAEEKRKSR